MNTKQNIRTLCFLSLLILCTFSFEARAAEKSFAANTSFTPDDTIVATNDFYICSDADLASYNSSLTNYDLYTFANDTTAAAAELATIDASWKMSAGSYAVYVGSYSAGKKDLGFVRSGTNDTIKHNFTCHNSINTVKIISGLGTLNMPYVFAAGDPVTYNVSFDSKGGSSVASQTITAGEKVIQPGNPTKTNCIFNCWCTDAACTTSYNFDSAVTSGFTLYAKWDIDPASITYNVTFDSKGGSNVASQIITNGSKVTKPTDPTKTNCIFDGWCIDQACTTSYNFDSAVTSNFTLYAKWKVDPSSITYTVNFDSKGGSNVASQVITNGNKVIQPASPTKTNCIFDGWYIDQACTTSYNFGSAVTSSFTLYAKWNVDPSSITYTVNFDSNGGSNVASQVITNGSKVAKPTDPTKTNYIFDCWCIDKACTTSYNFDSAVTSSFTLYAKWNVKEAETPSDDPKKPDPEKPDVTPKISKALSLSNGFSVKQSGKTLTIKFGKVDKATTYKIYVTYCGTDLPKKPTKKVSSSNTVKITKLNGSKLDPTKNFKVYVVAEGANGKIDKTPVAHVAGCKSSKYTNAKKINLTSSSSLTLKVGKTSKIKAKVVLVKPSKKQLPASHKVNTLRYASNNTSVATVSKNGKITAKGKGTCYIYVYAKNGINKKITVTVK